MLWSFSDSRGPPMAPSGSPTAQMDDLVFHGKARYKILLWDDLTVKRDLKLKAPLRKNNLKWVNYWFLTFIVILSWTYFHSCLLTLLQLYVFNRFFHPVIPRIWKYSILDYFSLRSKSREDSKYDYLRLSLVWQWFSLLTSSLPFPLNFPEKY